MTTLLTAKGLGLLIGFVLAIVAVLANADARCGLGVTIRRGVRRLRALARRTDRDEVLDWLLIVCLIGLAVL